MYDCAIIGTGPAGLEAALTLKARNKNFILIGSNLSSEKVYKAHEIKNYLGLPNILGNDFQNAFLNHIKLMDINITNDMIIQIYDMGDYYALQGKEEMYEAKSIIIATGVKMEKPYIGENELLGNGISYCATCDAQLYKNKDIITIVDSADELDEVNFLSEVVSNLKLIPLYDNNLENRGNIEVVNEKPVEIKKVDKKRVLITDKNEYSVDGIFILRKSVPLSYLLYGIEMDGSHIKVDRLMKTNLRGVFAAGDIVGKPYQYIKAAGEGNVAAISVVSFLDELRRNKNEN